MRLVRPSAETAMSAAAERSVCWLQICSPLGWCILAGVGVMLLFEAWDEVGS